MPISFFDTWIFTWIILPILIFLSRAADVSLGTMRIIFVSKGQRFFASLLGFFEILIWIVAITKVMQNITNFFYYIVYAGGFATGIYLGIIIEEKLALGLFSIHVFTTNDAKKLLKILRDNNYGVTSRIAQGEKGKINELFIVIRRKNLNPVMKILREYDPSAFISIEDVRFVKGGTFPDLSDKK
ncbi:MAG: DUF2179 domain-containing protein [candidate division WOR-3 bacterium]